MNFLEREKGKQKAPKNKTNKKHSKNRRTFKDGNIGQKTIASLGDIFFIMVSLELRIASDLVNSHDIILNAGHFLGSPIQPS